MWKVKLQQGYEKMDFVFDDFGDATNFIAIALSNSTNTTAKIYSVDKTEAGEENEV